jgi:hypothetical protein
MYKTTDKYFINYGKKGYRFCEIGLILDNLSEHQIEAVVKKVFDFFEGVWEFFYFCIK